MRSHRAKADQVDRELVMKGHMAFGERNGRAVVNANPLEPSTMATTIRPDGDGGFTVTDGAFPETKEVLGGYYLVEADDLDAALELAKQLPMPNGGVEVRPIRVMG